MDILKDILAALSVVLNGLPQGLLAMTFGFASVPTALAFVVGAGGNAIMGSVPVISYQAETITLAGTMGRNMRERLSMVFFGALIMVPIGLFGLLEKIIDWIGPVITAGMMAGVGIMLSKVAWEMARNDKMVGITSFASALIVYMATKDLVYTITISVILSSIVYLFLPKDGKEGIQAVLEEKITRQKLVINPMVIRGALAMVCLNIGANIAFGKINGEIAQTDVNVDVLTVISSLADMASAFFGGAPVEVVISATASAPHPVGSGVLMMSLMAIILFAGLLPKIGKFVPSSSIAGFLFVLGAIVTFPGNAGTAFSTGEPASGLIGGITMVVTAITDPFLGMLAGLIIQFLIGLFGF
ncbi:AGZA family xanthine/uracil permease-like MFS transporter [Bacillus thermophilus]|uniref:AGZA family xanthine/uracil permease-like MFS transporter n=2 Tax=Siminovitchia TaxID=2837510 RepID=A0ABS2RA67_9BACI|nr:guanine permease [Siminovitchia thermophila]MBM7716547.1 AGZA family xanthine/uracil permease-like MFS transporter [Siminovitchia thermophila]ONK24113.1 guanine permease [Bacillus sp. VT-16-64]